MIVKRDGSGDIEITLVCLNPNYASAAQLTGTVYSVKSIPRAAQARQECSGGECAWEISDGRYNLVLSAAATLIPEAQEGDVYFEVAVLQGGVEIPPHGNSSNPERKRARIFRGDSSIKTAIFHITIL